MKTVGDGFVAAFDGPGRAIECALAIRDALGAFDVVVRVGIHTGEIEVRAVTSPGSRAHLRAGFGPSRSR